MLISLFAIPFQLNHICSCQYLLQMYDDLGFIILSKTIRIPNMYCELQIRLNQSFVSNFLNILGAGI